VDANEGAKKNAMKQSKSKHGEERREPSIGPTESRRGQKVAEETYE